MTVLYLNLATWLGGGEHGIVNILKQGDRSRCNPVMLFGARGPFVDAVEGLGVRTLFVPFEFAERKKLLRPRAVVHNFRASLEIMRIARREEVDVVQCSDVLALLFLLPAVVRLRVPVVFNLILFFSGVRLVLFNILALMMVKKIVVLSEGVRRDVLGKTVGLDRKTAVIYWSVDGGIFRPRTRGERAAIRERLGLPAAARLVGLIGRFDVWKGHHTFLEAARRLLDRLGNVVFLVAGGSLTEGVDPAVGEYRRAVLGHAERLGFGSALLMLGHREDVPDIMASLDVFVCSSDVEPFGLVVLEALSCGVPAVVSRPAGVLEVLKGNAAVYVAEPKDPDSFASQIAKALASAPCRDGEPARTLTGEVPSWRDCARRYEDVYESLCAGAA